MIATDTYCIDALKTGRYASGTTLTAQRLYHALTTPRGALRGGEDEGSFGEDLSSIIGNNSNDAARQIKAKVARAASKDEDILSISTNVISTIESNGSTSFIVTISAESSTGPFEFVLAISDVTIALIGLK